MLKTIKAALDKWRVVECSSRSDRASKIKDSSLIIKEGLKLESKSNDNKKSIRRVAINKQRDNRDSSKIS